MSIHTGRIEEVGVAIESARNTPEAVAQKWVKHVNSGIISKVSKAMDNNVRGVMEDMEGARVTRKWFDGDLEGILHADVLGYFLLNIYGASDPTSEGGGAYSHEFTVDQVIEHPALTIFRKDGDVTEKAYGGGVVNTLEISATTDDYVRFTANIICGNETSSGDTPAYDTEYDFIGKDITIKLGDQENDLPSATALSCKEVSISFDTGAISDFNLGSYNPTNYNAKLAIEVKITKNFVDTTFEELFKSDTAKYMEITIQGDATIGGSSKPTIVLLLNKALVTDWAREGGADALATETMTLKAFYNSEDEQQSMLTLTNLTPAYVAAS